MLNRILPFALVMAWIFLIVSLSAHDAQTSSELSGSITHSFVTIIEQIQPDFSERIGLENIHSFIRGFAHFSLYLLLGVWSVNALSQFFDDWFRLVTDSTLFGLVIGVFDELFQSFIPGRVMSMNDIFIDTVGAFVGSVLMVLVLMKIKKMPIT